MAAMNEVADILPETVLLDYVRSQIPSNAHLWSFRKHLAVQYACQVGHVVCILRRLRASRCWCPMCCSRLLLLPPSFYLASCRATSFSSPPLRA